MRHEFLIRAIIISIRISHSVSLIHRPSIPAFNCFGLFFYFGEPPADRPSEGAAIAIGERLASADPYFDAG
jgi:hypothetical protein